MGAAGDFELSGKVSLVPLHFLLQFLDLGSWMLHPKMCKEL